MRKKVLITGGHPAPAFAVIERLYEYKHKVDIVFVGRKYATEGEDSLSFEYKEAAKYRLKFYDLVTGRFTRSLKRSWFINFIKVFMGLIRSIIIIKREDPDVILSFGSYIAVPICIAGFLFKKRIILHEQTLIPGLANKVCSLFASKIFVSFEKSKDHFPKITREKIEVIGNPIRRSVFVARKDPFEGKLRKNSRIVLYFTGGSLGSHSINEHVFNLLPLLVKKYIVIHQVGNIKKYGDYEKALKLKQQLGEKAACYFPREHFLDDEIGFVYKVADIVISRAGANTFFELLSLKKPAIFIPLPWSAGKEQLKQAKVFEKYGCGEIFNQNLESKKLLDLINKLVKNYENYVKAFGNLKRIYREDAAEKIIAEIFATV